MHLFLVCSMLAVGGLGSSVWGLHSGVQAEGTAQTWSTLFLWAREKGRTLTSAQHTASLRPAGVRHGPPFPVDSHSCRRAAVPLTLIMEWGGGRGSGLCPRDSPKPTAAGGAGRSSYREAGNSHASWPSQWQNQRGKLRKQSLHLHSQTRDLFCPCPCPYSKGRHKTEQAIQ